MRTPIITVFVICVLIIGLALAFYDYRRHGVRYESIDISRSDSDVLKNAKQTGEELSYKQDYEGAIAEYEKALRISPRDAYVRNDIGAAYYYLGLKNMQTPMTEEDFGLGTEVDGRHIDKKNTMQQTREALEKVTSGLITVVVNDQNTSKEIESYVKPLGHYVHIEEERNDTGGMEYWLTIITGKTKDAFLNAEKNYLAAIDLRSVKDANGRKYSNYSAASRNLGTLYFRMGKKKDAVKNWRRALQIEPTDAELRELIDKYE